MSSRTPPIPAPALPASPPARRRLTADARRDLIRDAALEVFARRGYHGASLDEIAQAAEISKALIYEHFPSKRELYVALLETHVQALFDRLASAAGTMEPGEVRLRAGVDAFLAFVEEQREAWRMLFRDAADPEVAEVLVRVQGQANDAVAALIAADPAARAQDDDRPLELAMLAQLLSGAVQSLANWWHDRPEVPRERLVDAVMDLTWVGFERLRAGERTGAPSRGPGRANGSPGAPKRASAARGGHPRDGGRG